MKVVISFKIDDRIKQSLQKLAEQENRNLSNYVTTVLIKHLEDRGVDWKDQEKPSKPRK
jgi:predicted transcriptional regulator